jgi:hypothetical protein
LLLGTNNTRLTGSNGLGSLVAWGRKTKRGLLAKCCAIRMWPTLSQVSGGNQGHHRWFSHVAVGMGLLHGFWGGLGEAFGGHTGLREAFADLEYPSLRPGLVLALGCWWWAGVSIR